VTYTRIGSAVPPVAPTEFAYIRSVRPSSQLGCRSAPAARLSLLFRTLVPCLVVLIIVSYCLGSLCFCCVGSIVYIHVREYRSLSARCLSHQSCTYDHLGAPFFAFPFPFGPPRSTPPSPPDVAPATLDTWLGSAASLSPVPCVFDSSSEVSAIVCLQMRSIVDRSCWSLFGPPTFGFSHVTILFLCLRYGHVHQFCPPPRFRKLSTCSIRVFSPIHLIILCSFRHFSTLTFSPSLSL
jgi:hypothetical protein